MIKLGSLASIDAADRWSIYRRLQQLSIPCKCRFYQPLKVKVDSAMTAIQVWSVARQVTAPRQNQIDWLQRCWDIEYSQSQ